MSDWTNVIPAIMAMGATYGFLLMLGHAITATHGICRFVYRAFVSRRGDHHAL